MPVVSATIIFLQLATCTLFVDICAATRLICSTYLCAERICTTSMISQCRSMRDVITNVVFDSKYNLAHSQPKFDEIHF